MFFKGDGEVSGDCEALRGWPQAVQDPRADHSQGQFFIIYGFFLLNINFLDFLKFSTSVFFIIYGFFFFILFFGLFFIINVSFYKFMGFFLLYIIFLTFFILNVSFCKIYGVFCCFILIFGCIFYSQR